jgi:ribose transport system ATP-binding protein
LRPGVCDSQEVAGSTANLLIFPLSGNSHTRPNQIPPRCCAYMFCGLMAAVAGLVVAARIGSGDPQAGSQFTLSSIAAVVVGGTSVFGGRGTLVGTLLGVMLLMLLQNVLNELHVTAYYQYIWTGALLLFSVALYSLREYRSQG